MIDVAKLDALEHQLRNRRFDGLAPELIEVIGLARLVLAAQAAPGESAGVYVASKAKHYRLWQELRAAGHPIISTWIDEGGEGETSDWASLWTRCQQEASSAKALIVYREDGEELKGALIEIGCALAHGRPVFTVGPMNGSWPRHPLVTATQSLDDAFARAALLAAALHRPVEARVTEETASAEIEKRMNELVDLLAVFMDTKIDDRAWSQLLVYAPSSLPSPQVMRGEVDQAIDLTLDRDVIVDRVCELFGRAKP